jgi:Nuclease-related domain
MCKVYNSVGSLTAINFHLHQHHINDFNSLDEIIAFQKDFSTCRQEIISKHEYLIEEEKNGLEADISKLENTIRAMKINIASKLTGEIDKLEQKLNNLVKTAPTNFIQRITNYLKEWYYTGEIQHKEFNLESKIAYAIRKLVEVHTEKNNRYQYIISHFEEALNESCFVPLKDLERKKSIIDEVNNSIYGALGEQKVVRELEKLSDEYFLINDFCLSFPKPMYNRHGNDYIKSIQIDHILVALSGIFLIETKNWSENSLNDPKLWSPVQQIKRTGFVLFKMLNEGIAKYRLNLSRHHWGKKKISVRNLLVFTNSKPEGEFQYVKILTVPELLGYVTYFKPAFSNKETQEIANYLLKLAEPKEILL